MDLGSLFSLYGLMVNEINVADISIVSLVAHQLSVSVRSLMLIKETQNAAKKELQASLGNMRIAVIRGNKSTY